MSIHDEQDLRGQLGAALDGLAPGPLPLAAVVRQGRMVMIRKRVAVAACVAVLAAVGVAAPTLAREIGKPGPAASASYHLTVYPPGRGAPSERIATGRLGKLRWRVFGKFEGSGQDSICLGLNGSSGCGGAPARIKLTGPITEPSIGLGRHPGAYFWSVRGDVIRLRLTLSNGQVITLRPVKVFGQRYAAYAGLLLPSAAAVTMITGYSAHGEIGYEIPFTRFGTVLTPILLKPGQPPLPRPHTYLIGSGTVRGRNWKERLFVGPWGSCVGKGIGEGRCLAIAPRDLVGDRLVRVLFVSYRESSSGVAVFAVASDVSYLRFSPKHGAAFTVRCNSMAGARMCAAGFVPVATWSAYAADGTKLDSGKL